MSSRTEDQELSLLENLMFCMVHYDGDETNNPLRDRIADEFPTLAKRYPCKMAFVWVKGTEQLVRVGVLPGDFHDGRLPPSVLREIVWRVEKMNVHVWC